MHHSRHWTDLETYSETIHERSPKMTYSSLGTIIFYMTIFSKPSVSWIHESSLSQKRPIFTDFSDGYIKKNSIL